MLLLQILLVPLFALILLAAVFIIGVASVTSPPDDSYNDNPLIQME